MTTDLNRRVREFHEYLDKMQALGRAVGLSHWDQSTGAPKGGVAGRSKFTGILAGMEFSMKISAQMKHFIDELGADRDILDELTRGLLRRCQRDYDAYAGIPPDEYGAFCELTARAEAAWEDAKHRSDYSLFKPFLSDIIAFKKRFVEYRGYDKRPYDALLDEFEPGMTVDQLDLFFGDVKGAVVPLLKRIIEARNKGGVKPVRTDFLSGVPRRRQLAVTRLVCEKLGYDFDRGLIAESEHPFSTSFGRNDCRITTHYLEENWLSSFFSVAHEAGHAIYEQNKRPDIQDTLMDDGVSCAIHESQSRFYENIVCRRREFWDYIYDDMKNALSPRLDGVGADELFAAANIVEPGPIRIEADEVTYPLHVLVRYELEKAVFEEGAGADDLPALWNEKYARYLGVAPKNDAEGILQDVHWSDGSFGYFPSYAVGSAYSAQFLAYMNREFDVGGAVANGGIQRLTGWLREHIHQYGGLRTPDELVRGIAGEGFDSKYYVDYLNGKYYSIYRL